MSWPAQCCTRSQHVPSSRPALAAYQTTCPPAAHRCLWHSLPPPPHRSLPAPTAAVQDQVAEQHSAVHAFHHHIPRGDRRSGSSGTGIIWLLILLHLVFVGYWGEPLLGCMGRHGYESCTAQALNC